ncbi:MAG: pepsin/retropepsin-like aspartic protease family protein [Planctomycetota bacterium]
MTGRNEELHRSRPLASGLRWVVATAVLTLLLTGCFPTIRHVPERTRLPDSATVLPIDYRNGELIANVALDGQGPFRLKLDTGASVNAISEVVRGKLGIETSGRMPWRLTGAGESRWRSIVSGRIDQVSCGDVQFDGVDCLVLDDLEDDGFVGNGLFDVGLLTLDFPESKFTLAPGRLAARADTVPFRLGAGVPLFFGVIDERPVEFTIDTGFNGWIRLPLEWESKLEFVGGRYAIDVQTIHRVRNEVVRQIDGDLVIGPHRLRRPIVVLGPGAPLIGTRGLEAFRVTLDFGEKRVRFERASAEPIPVPVLDDLFGASVPVAE